MLPGFALKSRQKLGKKGGGQRLNLEVVERLKVMFIQGNINKNMKLSSKDMLEKLKNMSDDGEIEKENIPKLTQIESWISRFNQQYKKEAAIRTHLSMIST